MYFDQTHPQHLISSSKHHMFFFIKSCSPNSATSIDTGVRLSTLESMCCLSGNVSLRRNDSLFPSSHRSPVAPQIGLELKAPPLSY